MTYRYNDHMSREQRSHVDREFRKNYQDMEAKTALMIANQAANLLENFGEHIQHKMQADRGVQSNGEGITHDLLLTTAAMNIAKGAMLRVMRSSALTNIEKFTGLRKLSQQLNNTAVEDMLHDRSPITLSDLMQLVMGSGDGARLGGGIHVIDLNEAIDIPEEMLQHRQNRPSREQDFRRAAGNKPSNFRQHATDMQNRINQRHAQDIGDLGLTGQEDTQGQPS
jgi:hypothetical protein